jgi:O-antigen/teichoic acid export membrane protein
MALRSSFLLLVFGRLVTALIAVASLRVLTTLLAPSDYGQWALLVAFQTFCGLFLINPVDQHVFRHAHKWWDDGIFLSYLAKFDQYIRFVSLFIMVAVILWSYYSQGDGNNNLVLGLAAGMVVGFIVYIGTWNTMFVAFLNVFGFRAQSVIWMITSALVGLTFSTFFVMQYPHAISWIFGQALGAAVGAIGAWRTLRSHSVKISASNKHFVFADFLNRSTILRFCLPLAAATGFMWLQNTGYRFWVGGVWGVAELGILVVGLGVSAQLAAIIESLAMQFLYPYFARSITDAKSEKEVGAALSDLMNVLAPIYAIWAGFNAVCAGAFLEMLTDARYHVAVPFVIFGAMIEFVRCITNLWSNTARAIRRTKGLILPYGLGATVVWLGAIGAAHFEIGLNGLSFVLVIAGIVTCAAMIILMQRLLPISIDVPRLAIGLSVMGACFALAIIMPMQLIGPYQNLVFLLLSGAVASSIMVAMLLRNPALTRLLSASLR